MHPTFTDRRKMQAGFERIQLILALAIALALIIILMPTGVRKYKAEEAIRMKALLRTFHSANEAYKNRHPDQGYASSIDSLVQNKERVRYLAPRWLNPKIENFTILYQAPLEQPRGQFSLQATRNSFFKASFCIDHRGVIRSQNTEDALEGDAYGCRGGIEVV